MKKIISRALLTWMIFATLFVLPVFPVQAQTREWGGNCVANDDGNVGSGGDVATIQGLECLIANLFSVALTVIGLAGFVMLLIGSYRYLVSGGNSKGTEQARNTLTYAVVGLVVALSAFIILNLIAEFTGVDEILQFRIQLQNTNSPGAPTGGYQPV